MKSFLQPVPEAKGIGYNHEFFGQGSIMNWQVNRFILSRRVGAG
jgi:hypothetical protein